MASLAVPSFGSWHRSARVLSPLQQWRGNINYHFVRVNSVCGNTRGDGEGGKKNKKHTTLAKPISNEVVPAQC